MKMKPIFFAASLLFVSIFLIISCRKEDPGNTSTTEAPDKTVRAGLQGRVSDENGLPVAGAAVTSGSAITTTDINGVFRFSDIVLSERWGFVKVVKPGYFTGSRTIITHAGATNFVEISLLPKSSAGDFTAASGGDISLSGGPALSFTGSSVMTADGHSAYTGTVHVLARYLDPTDEELSRIMPGDLRGVSAEGKETGLQSFGMMAVELEGDAGEKLQLASGKQATITMPIPASLQAKAPASIPLWHFNDTTGKWIGEGNANRVGNNYVGQVSHFSYWNWDYPCGIVFFELDVKDQHGNPVPYGNVQFQSDVYGTQGGQTDLTGHTQGWLIKGGTYTMRIKDDCGTTLYTQQVGPALADQDLGEVTVTVNRASLELTGTVVDCAKNPVGSGYINAFVDGLNYRAEVANGHFTLSVNRCSGLETKVTLVATDNATMLESEVKTFSAGSGTIDAGMLTACGMKTEQYIHFTMNDQLYTIQSPGDSVTIVINSSGYWAAGGGETGRPTVIFSLPKEPGAVTYKPGVLLVDDGYTAFYAVPNTAICTIDTFGDLYGYIEGNFAATVRSQEDSTAIYPVTGDFKVKRTY